MRFLFLFTFVFLHFNLAAQISQPTRYELELDNFYGEYYTASAEEAGLFLFQEIIEEVDNKGQIWEIIRLDTNLQKINRQEVLIDDKFIFRGYNYNDGKFVMLFQEGYEYAKNILFLTFPINSDTFESYLYENIVPIKLTELEIKNDAVVFGGNVDNRPVVMMYDFTIEKGKILPGLYNDTSSLLQIETKTEDNTIRVITLDDRLQNKQFGITVRGYSVEGEQIFIEKIEAQEEISLTDGKILNSNKSGNFLAGTYLVNRRTEYSNGFYVANFNTLDNDQINYFNYGELENFFNYMKENKRKRTLRKISRKKIKGQKLHFNYRLYVQNIVKHGNQSILMGEAYYPDQSLRSGFGESSYYSEDPFINNRSRHFSDRYNYTHAVIIAFDEDGKLIWDNSFEINDLKSANLEDHVQLAFLENEIVMLYLYQNELKVKVIKENKTTKAKFTESLKLKYENDELISNNQNLEGLKHWYGNNFYSHGVNNLKNLTDDNIKLNRKVFFINKIVVE